MTIPLIKYMRRHINTKAQMEETDTRGADFKRVSVRVRSPYHKYNGWISQLGPAAVHNRYTAGFGNFQQNLRLRNVSLCSVQ